jgi:phosphatidylserine/phosphatidylglycerophosphate/cardiolipin synthase-like enzyme
MIVADGRFAMIGSSNLDARSSAINEELDLTIYDERLAPMEAVSRPIWRSRSPTPSSSSSSAQSGTSQRMGDDPFRSQL